MNSWKYPAFWLTIGLVIAAGVWPYLNGSNTTRERMFLILLAVGLASSLNILLGYAGYVSFGHIVFFGLGGYVGFYLIAEQSWSLWLAALAGGLAAGLLALLLGLAILRLRGAYFALIYEPDKIIYAGTNDFDIFLFLFRVYLFISQ